MNKKIKSMLALVMSMMMATSFVACGGGKDSGSAKPADSSNGTSSSAGGDSSSGGNEEKVSDPDKVTYNTTTATMPSNWNEFTYDDNNDTQIMSYIAGSFFTYDYDFGTADKYNADGSINKDAIVEGSFVTKYDAVSKIEDVTATVASKWGYTEKEKTEGGYAWKMTFRDDLKWDDGTKIDATSFEYSMKELLNPDFMNMRANTYYDTLRVKNSRAYFYKNQEVIYNAIGDKGYASNAEAVAAQANIYVNVCQFWKDLSGQDISGLVDSEGNKIPQWLPIGDETGYDDAAAWGTEDEGPISAKDIWDAYLNPETGAYASYAEVGGSYASAWLGIPEVNNNRDVEWEDVGVYAEGNNSLVICLGKSYQFLKEDDSLSYLAAYYMSGLPLVKEDLYEKCKQEPVEGSTLWTSNYNSDLATTASWGPYKLAEFQSGKSYKLVKNDNWYGYNMDEYKNQYNVDIISCECVPESSTQWMKFLAGETDDASLDSDHINDYQYSKYTTYSPGTGTFGMQLFGDKLVLKNSNNNNGILAIDEFRQAFSYSLNRADIVETIWPGTSVACLGLMNSMYFYDVENGNTLEDQGIYRNTTAAKEGLLRAYGYTQADDGTWSNGAEIEGYDLDEAYETLTGYNPTLAKELVKKAYKILTENAEEYGYDANRKITLVYGSSVDTAKQRERAAYLQKVLDELCKDTDLEGQIEVVFDASAGSNWADAFRSGDTQIGFGYGFSGNALNPFDIVGSFVNPDDDLNYHTYWDTTAVDMTLTMPAGDYEGAGETITMDLQNWYFCLNGLATEYDAEFKYNWDAGMAPSSVRLVILAALEEQAIKKCYSVMLIGEYSGSLLSPKFTQFSDSYNTFMGFGGMRYLEANYNNAEWAAYVKSQNNDLTNEYKKEE